MLKQFAKKQIVKICKRFGETSPLLLDFSSIADVANATYLLDTMRTSRFLEPQEINAPQNKKILIIAPHPDDEVIGMGGTLAQMQQNNCDIEVIYLTFGLDDKCKQEAFKCADLLKYKCAHFFNFIPKQITFDNEALLEFSSIIKRTNPDIVFIPFMLDDHDDHRLANDLLLKIYENKMLSESSDIQIWAYQVYTSLPLNAVVNITDVINIKSKAIQCYQSRFRQRDWEHFAKGLSAFNVRFLPNNNKSDYAELFLKVSLPNYLKMCRTYFRSNGGQCYETAIYNKKP